MFWSIFAAAAGAAAGSEIITRWQRKHGPVGWAGRIAIFSTWAVVIFLGMQSIS